MPNYTQFRETKLLLDTERLETAVLLIKMLPEILFGGMNA